MSFGLEVALTPPSNQIKVGLFPVLNILTSMTVIMGMEPGLESWFHRSGHTLPREMVRDHQALFFGIGMEALANAVHNAGELESFARYLQVLEATEPETLRDTLLYWTTHSTHSRIDLDQPHNEAPDADQLLADEAVFMQYMAETNPKTDSLPGEHYRELHALLNHPPALQARLVAHLRTLWERFVLVEWERQRPHLEESVRALQRLDIQRLPTLDAIQAITGRTLRGLFDLDMLNSFARINLIPSRHTAPYVVWFGTHDTLNIVFGARQGVGVDQLDPAELLNRLQALSDETRLLILMAIKRHEELSTQQIMDIFDLNKSAASRHLKQLRANELIHERRDTDNKTKFYSLKPETMQAITRTLDSLF